MFEAKINFLTLGKKIFCKKLSIQFQPGDFCCLMGMNGSGKTTLLHTLAGLRQAETGSILLNQKPLNQYGEKERAKQIGLLLQDQITPFSNTVYDGLLAARFPHRDSTLNNSHIQKALHTMGLIDLKNRLISELSGGEQQRLHIAMLLTQNPQIYILDEPTNHLDLRYQIKTLQLLKNLSKQENKIIIAVIHDINLVSQFADQVCFLYEDGSTEFGLTKELFHEDKLGLLYNQPIKKISSIDGNHFWFAYTQSGE